MITAIIIALAVLVAFAVLVGLSCCIVSSRASRYLETCTAHYCPQCGKILNIYPVSGDKQFVKAHETCKNCGYHSLTIIDKEKENAR